MTEKKPRKTSKQLIDASKNLADKVDTALVETGEVAIEVRGLTFQELTYARSKARACLPKDKSGKIIDEAAAEIALKQWYLRFGIKSVQGSELPREVLDIGICKLSVLPEATLEPLYTYPDMAEALYVGIVTRTHNTEDELDGLDFSTLFSIPTSLAAEPGSALSAQA